MTQSKFKLLASQSFQRNHPVAKQESFVEHCINQLDGLETAIAEFVKAVVVMAKNKAKKSLEDRYLYRRWVINQAKKWGIPCRVIHENLAHYGGNYL